MYQEGEIGNLMSSWKLGGELEKSNEQLKSEALGLLMEHNTRVMNLCEIGFDCEDKIKPYPLFPRRGSVH